MSEKLRLTPGVIAQLDRIDREWERIRADPDLVRAREDARRLAEFVVDNDFDRLKLMRDHGRGGVEIDAVKTVKVNAKTLKIYAKVRDSASYTLLDSDGQILREVEDGYVPGFMPGDHFGDYLILDIDIDTGQITNWRAPSKVAVEEFIRGDER